MATAGSKVTKQSIVDDFNTYVKDPAYNTCVYWNGNYPTNMDPVVLGPRDVSEPTASSISGSAITASGIINVCKTYAKYTTVYRRVRYGLITDSGTSGDTTRVCRTKDSYQLTYTYSNGTLADGVEIDASELISFLQAMRNVADDAQTSATVIDARVCHSSCHSNCHSSRGRR